jgi:hypothetical protein
MDIRILKNKKTISIDGKEFIDLSENILSDDTVYDSVLGIDCIDENYEMRIDLISLKWYGTTENIDILLKANNIFNPYSIKEGDFLIIPAVRTDDKQFKSKTPGTSEITKKYTDVSRMTKQEISKLKDLVNKSKDKKNRLKNPLPPNMLQEGEVSKKIENGFVDLTANS